MSAKPDLTAPLKVLLVEDNRDTRTTMRMLLSLSFGYDVYEAPDGASGVRLALEVKPDVALIDLGLPDVDGHEVARRIRAVLDTREIMLVAVTGYGSTEDRRLTQESGFDAHLVKPVESADLVRIFEGLVRAREARALK